MEYEHKKENMGHGPCAKSGICMELQKLPKFGIGLREDGQYRIWNIE